MANNGDRNYGLGFFMVMAIIFFLIVLLSCICPSLLAQEIDSYKYEALDELPILKPNELEKKDIVDRMELLQCQLIAARNAMVVWQEKIKITKMEINNIEIEMKQLIEERSKNKKVGK